MQPGESSERLQSNRARLCRTTGRRKGRKKVDTSQVKGEKKDEIRERRQQRERKKREANIQTE